MRCVFRCSSFGFGGSGGLGLGEFMLEGDVGSALLGAVVR